MIFYIWQYTCLSVSTRTSVCAGAHRGQKNNQALWNWGYGRLSATLWVLGLNLDPLQEH